jgi:predicted enzyme related to lactoylglutathione lyase
MANPFCFVAFNTDDVTSAKSFYGKVFDWKLEDGQMPGKGPYTMIQVGEGVGGALMKKDMPEAPTAWLPYVRVGDVAATVRRARELGAKIVVDKTDVPPMGAFAIFVDPAGAALGVWEDAKK